ncbi:MAG: hypothetical protein P794_05455 [Epsilonproteobacteria bacterium (ex Lamellibrachia satsuma)]|nr:MAG: hypothetical protein P794_05455 [Epsilonproteobacteria bacterium (ex Lamellibrachia satsuma)]
MILKLIIFAIAGLFIYKLLGGKLPSIGKNNEEKKIDEDTLVECSKCGTYVTIKESIIVNGKYYCSKECLD